MDQTKVAKAAQLLVEARRSGVPLRELPPECRPSSVTETNQVIDEITRLHGESIGGWKIAFMNRPREKPYRAPLFSSLILKSPAQVPLAFIPSLQIEFEIMFRLLDDLPPRAGLYRPAELADAVEACASLEIIHTRFDASYRSIHEMLAVRSTQMEVNCDHITNGAVVIGDARRDWQKFDFADLPVRMTCGNRVVVENRGGHAFTDPFLPVVVLANALRHGPGMKKGQIVVTGSFTSHHKVEADQPIVGEFVGFGKAEAMFVS